MATATSDSQLSDENHYTTDMESLKAHQTPSSGAGGCPPSRRRIRRAATMAAWDARSAKNSAVFMAETFSATAVVTN